VEVARFLLDHGVDATAQNKYGTTPLRLALQAGHVEVARLLVDYGSDTTGMDEQVTNPWQVALHQGDMGLARLFEPDANAAT
jgi:ankyrin repeat protein